MLSMQTTNVNPISSASVPTGDIGTVASFGRELNLPCFSLAEMLAGVVTSLAWVALALAGMIPA